MRHKGNERANAWSGKVLRGALWVRSQLYQSLKVAIRKHSKSVQDYAIFNNGVRADEKRNEERCDVAGKNRRIAESRFTRHTFCVPDRHLQVSGKNLDY
ncbi:hypothetical protein Zmor_020576 [Zophobas morio]|uniref:Uncharacterized protein n=1 Tax=Zophobas morio TaxID=2755281 RepID=A0AA38M9S5_9CUCU|nr:hypothetical protein Zmor_020576 [Zophobas morio]